MIVICFPGGAGGHYIGYMTKCLIAQQPTIETVSSNFHRLFKPNQSFLNFSLLDSTMHSIEEEQCYINRMRSNSDIILGHFRKINWVSKRFRPTIISIELDPDDIDLITQRIINEAIKSDFDIVKYDDIKGDMWPETNPGYANLPRWIQIEIESLVSKTLYFWNEQVDYTEVVNCCRISTKDVFYGDAVTKLAEYFNVPVVDNALSLQQKYQQLVQKKYIK